VVGDVFHEFCRFLRRDSGDGSDLDPFGELVHCHQDVLVVTRGRSERSHRLQALYSEGPGRRDCPQGLSLHVLLLVKELSPFASPD
jgi:hypothetical protein